MLFDVVLVRNEITLDFIGFFVGGGKKENKNTNVPIFYHFNNLNYH